jgi:hypothetical protein
MPANPQIALGVQPMQLQMPDPNAGMNSLARMMQIRGMQDEQQVNALTLQGKQRDMERRNKLDSLLGVDYAKPEERESALMKGGFLEEAGKLSKERRDATSQRVTDDAKAVETAQKRVESWGQTMGWVRQNPTPESAVSAVRYLVTIGVIPQEMAQAALANVGNDPQSITQWATQGFQAALSAKDQLPKYDTRNLGGTTQTTAIDPVTGQLRVVNSVANTQSPDSVASVGAQYANAQATRDAAATTAAATRDAAAIQRGFESEQGLRKEFEALPEVKKYKQALPSYKGIEDAVKRNTTQSDINIVYGIAKLYDPDSVVREGEYATVASSPNIPERIKGYAQYLAGGGRLTAQVKAEILAEAQSRMRAYETEFVGARTNFESIAKRTNVDPTRVFPSPVSPAIDPTAVGSKREARGKVTQGPSVFDQADAILRGGR